MPSGATYNLVGLCSTTLSVDRCGVGVVELSYDWLLPEEYTLTVKCEVTRL